jgi:uncharacterized membrane protein YkoI
MKKLVTAAVIALSASGVAGAQTASRPVGLVEAVRVAEAHTGAGAFEAEEERVEGRMLYEIDLARGQTIRTVRVDAATGKVVSVASPRLANTAPDWFGDDRPTAPKRIAPMLAAIEQRTKGEVREVGFDVDNGAEVYEIDVATAAGLAELHFDARTGKRMLIAYAD